MDQTPSKYIQSSGYTMEKPANKSVEITRSGDKRALPATFINGKFPLVATDLWG